MYINMNISCVPIHWYTHIPVSNKSTLVRIYIYTMRTYIHFCTHTSKYVYAVHANVYAIHVRTHTHTRTHARKQTCTNTLHVIIMEIYIPIRTHIHVCTLLLADKNHSAVCKLYGTEFEIWSLHKDVNERGFSLHFERTALHMYAHTHKHFLPHCWRWIINMHRLSTQCVCTPTQLPHQLRTHTAL